MRMSNKLKSWAGKKNFSAVIYKNQDHDQVPGKLIVLTLMYTRFLLCL